ncbi:DUF3137 domain-containing protein [Persicirhabdus sediminis]|uniref:DUF3137 domain-containing protein n=1 Tax=Persicirhabdus sediminis TaxID=454144 RepID=A0A8J7MEA8_9BACT|nr:DUF3137 domain-containing protein [Persicirhabdus sediminis]MBK1791427.1 DUF3137 domain-containing protein [Persicirhabdus sediminis]
MSQSRSKENVSWDQIWSKLQPLAGELEVMRQDQLQKLRDFAKKISLTVLVISAIGMLMLISDDLQVFGMVVIAASMVIGCLVYHFSRGGHKSDFVLRYKSQLMRGLVKSLEPQMDYHPTAGISRSEYNSYGLYKTRPDRYHSEDLFIGSIGGTELKFAEVHAEVKRTRRDSQGRTSTYWVTIFKGVILQADFHKEFYSWTTVMPDVAEKSFGWFGRKFQSLGGNLVRLECPEFERDFVVRSGDQIEARYILTPDMQERLLKLHRRFGAQSRFVFSGSKLMMSLPVSGNLFEPKYDSAANCQNQLKRITHEMQGLFSIVESLNLNTRIWSKQ